MGKGLTNTPHPQGNGPWPINMPPKPWSGGLPPNPIPTILPVIGKQISDNPGLHLGWLKGRFNPHNVNPPVPVTIPNRFRITPPPVDFGQRPSKNLAGAFHGLQDQLNLHESVLPSNPIVFKRIQQVDNNVNQVLNSTPAARNGVASIANAIKKVINGE